MTWTWRALTFLAAFTLEVRVRAQEWVTLPTTGQVFQLPENCIQESSTCAVRTQKKAKYTLKSGQQKVTLSGGTSYLRRGANGGSLLAGTILVKTQEALDLEMPYGTLKAEKAEFILTRKKDRYLVRVLDGAVVFQPVGAQDPIAISKGYENWMGPVGPLGVARSGLPAPASLHQLLLSWGALFDGTKKEFETAVRHFQVAWRDAVLNSSSTYEHLVKREIASEKERERKRAIQRAIEAAERKKVNDLFRKKIFE